MPETSIVLVPGFWEGPSVYTPVLELLRQDSDYSVIVGVLPSTGVPSPGNPTLADDTTTIRCLIESQINGDKDVVLVLHSAGGYIGCNAIQGLTAKERTGRGLKGGVKRIVFLCAGIFEKGSTTGFMPFFDIKGEELHCKDARNVLFNDAPDAVAESWLARFQCQPAKGWDGEITHNGAMDALSTYLICESDVAVPPTIQQRFADLAGSEVEHCDAGHMVMISQPQTVAGIVKRAARSIYKE